MVAKAPLRIDPDSLKRMRERTRQIREDEANRLFTGENVDTVLSDAAKRGHSSAIFAPATPMDIQATEAGKAAQVMLKGAGFSAEWKQSRSSPEADVTNVLRVSWGADAKPGES